MECYSTTFPSEDSTLKLSRLKYLFNKPHTWRAQQYWNIKHRVKPVPRHILDQLYVTGDTQIITVQGQFRKFQMMRGDSFTLAKDKEYIFTFDDLLELVST